MKGAVEGVNGIPPQAQPKHGSSLFLSLSLSASLSVPPSPAHIPNGLSVLHSASSGAPGHLSRRGRGVDNSQGVGVALAPTLPLLTSWRIGWREGESHNAQVSGFYCERTTEGVGHSVWDWLAYSCVSVCVPGTG